jgi:hypothetical protein
MTLPGFSRLGFCGISAMAASVGTLSTVALAQTGIQAADLPNLRMNARHVDLSGLKIAVKTGDPITKRNVE